MFFNRKKVKPPVAPKAKKPTKKAAGVKAPAAPSSGIVAHIEKATKEDKREPLPVTIVPPKPETEAVVLPNPDPPVRPPDPPKAAKPMKGLRPEEEIIEIEKQIESLKARIWEIEHPVEEFPKMVKGVTFQSRKDQDAAGPDYADKKEAKEPEQVPEKPLEKKEPKKKAKKATKVKK